MSVELTSTWTAFMLVAQGLGLHCPCAAPVDRCLRLADPNTVTISLWNRLPSEPGNESSFYRIDNIESLGSQSEKTVICESRPKTTWLLARGVILLGS